MEACKTRTCANTTVARGCDHQGLHETALYVNAYNRNRTQTHAEETSCCADTSTGLRGESVYTATHADLAGQNIASGVSWCVRPREFTTAAATVAAKWSLNAGSVCLLLPV